MFQYLFVAGHVMLRIEFFQGFSQGNVPRGGRLGVECVFFQGRQDFSREKFRRKNRLQYFTEACFPFGSVRCYSFPVSPVHRTVGDFVQESDQKSGRIQITVDCNSGAGSRPAGKIAQSRFTRARQPELKIIPFIQLCTVSSRGRRNEIGDQGKVQSGS